MAIKYIPFDKEPVEGQALLDNFTRTKRVLRYKSSEAVYDDIKRGMPLYEAKLVEKVGNNDKNLLVRGECISACAYLKEKGIKVDLVYIDPPFASGADYAKKIYIRRNPVLAEKMKKAEEELDNKELKKFEEKMYGDKWNKEAYLNWMYDNLMAIKSIMSRKGSIYVQLDSKIGHYVKILMDEIFGEENFQNEIVWQYQGSWDEPTDHFPKRHQVIYFYKISNDEDTVFNRQFEYDIDEGVNYNRWKEYIEDNKIYAKNAPYHDKRFDTYVNRFIKENGRKPKDDDVLIEFKGSVIGDVWYVKAADPKSAEYTGYATQKPDNLLKRIIESSSEPGKDMIVADFFGGSGVTAKVANDLGRNFIHCDVGINSIQTTRDKLVENNAEFNLLEIQDGINLYRNPVQTMDKIKSLIPGLKNEEKIDKFWVGTITDTKNGTMPVYVPNLEDVRTRVLDLPMINRIIHESMPDLDSSINKVIIYYIDLCDEQDIINYIQRNNNTGIEIELRDLKIILDNTVVDDIVEFDLKNEEDKYCIEIKKFISDRLIQKISEYNQKMTANSKNDKLIEISDEGLELIEYISLDCTNNDGVWKSDSEIKIDKLGYVETNGHKTKDFWNCKIYSDKKPLRIKVRNIAGDEIVENI